MQKKARRFCINPDRTKGQWLEPAYMASTHKDWLDVTDWPDEQLADYVMDNRLPHGQAECMQAQAELF